MAMNLLNDGILNILKHFESLEYDWDGYKAKPINKTALDKLKDMSVINDCLMKFRAFGFQDSDVYIIPVATGNIQLEAQRKDIYAEITLR